MSKKNIIVLSGGILLLSIIGALFFFNIVFKSNDARLNNEIQLGDDYCFSDANCDEGYGCFNNHCQKIVSGNGKCYSHSDCRNGKKCYQGKCVEANSDNNEKDDEEDCTTLVANCHSCTSYNKKLCAKCDQGYTLKNGVCQINGSPTPVPTNTEDKPEENDKKCNIFNCVKCKDEYRCEECGQYYTLSDTGYSCNPIEKQCHLVIGEKCYEFTLAKTCDENNYDKGPCPTNTVSPTQQPAPVTCSSITNGSACFNAGCYWDYGKSECLNLKPSFTPIPTTQPTVTPSATPISSDPEITCLNSVYSGSLIYKPIAECSNGTFSSGENIYKTTVIGAHNVTCHGTNGKNVTKTCWLYRSSDEIPGGVKEQNSSNPEITCVSSAFSGFLNPQIIAECSNGTFSNGDNVYKTTVIGVQTLTCYGNNGQNVTKACRLYQSIDVIPEAERPHNKDNNDKSQNVKKKLGLGADCNEDSECESNYCNKILFGLMGVCAGIGGDPNNRDNANFYVYTENTSYSSNVPDDCQYIDGYLVTPEASENSSDRVCQYNIVDDTSKCDGSDSCYRVVEYVKEKHESHDNKNLKMAIFIALSGIIVASVVYAYITYVRKK